VKNQSKAAVELLIRHRRWLQALAGEEPKPSPDSVRRFARCGLDGEFNLCATLEWTAMAEHLHTAGHTYPSPDVKVFLVAASLREGVPVDLGEITEDLDTGHAQLIAEAITYAAWPLPRTVPTPLDAQPSPTS
jgi:hypothetical protein